jgi:S1-C subfamily serine protease
MRFHTPFQSAIAGLLLTATLALTGVAAEAAEPAAAGAPTLPATTGTVKSNAIEMSVVKVFATVSRPDLWRPWTKNAPYETTGSGVVIEGRRILSNAHVVQHASQVQVQANQAGDKLSATVETIAPGIDLAVLKLDDESFFDTHPPLPRAKELPEIKDVVMTYGYPEGGTTLSITKGIVSRIEFTAYSYFVAGLRIQIDAAINPGNSGGPAVAGDRMIGLAFSHLGGADNIGYIIPCEEIELFLQDLADGRYDGKYSMYDQIQTLENAALRASLKLDKSVEGVMIHEPASREPAYPLKEWDVIARIGDVPVDNQGMVRLEPNLRLGFQYLIQRFAKNGKVPLTVVRAARELPVELPLGTTRPMVIPGLLAGYPSYFVYGPLVFSVATRECLEAMSAGEGAWHKWNAEAGSPLASRKNDRPAFEGERLVFISSPFLPHKLAKGYGNPFSFVVKTVNGIPVKNFNHLVEILRDARNEFITVQYDRIGGETMVFPRAEMAAATEEILADNGIRSQGSPDALAIWNARR